MRPFAQDSAASSAKPLALKTMASLATLIVALIVVVAVFASLYIFGGIDLSFAGQAVPTPVDASAATEVIADDGSPLGAFQHDALCNIHLLIYLCIFMTLVYGATVVYRRLNDVKAFKEMDDAVSGRAHAAKPVSELMEDLGQVGA